MQNKNTHVLSLIIALLVALSQLSETIYTPSLPDLARDFGVLESYAEYTLTSYLVGFAFGVLIWGTFSDYYGRKRGVIAGLVLYTIGSAACWLSKDITTLYFCRFLQAFGASVGSVLGQAIARDAFLPEERGRVYSVISMVIAFAPAVGPFVGSMTIEYFHWSAVFVLLVGFGLALMGFVHVKLPETNTSLGKNKFSLTTYKNCAMEMVVNKRVWGFSVLIGFINGIIFSYFAESPFYFVDLLGVSKSTFGIMAMYICIPLFVGGLISKRMNSHKVPQDKIILYGILLVCLAGVIYVFLTNVGIITLMDQTRSVAIALGCMFFIMMGNAIIIPNCFSQALEPFGKFAGTSASLFGFVYYVFISLSTGVMGYMHDGTLRPMPVFLLVSGLGMLIGYMVFIYKPERRLNTA